MFVFLENKIEIKIEKTNRITNHNQTKNYMVEPFIMCLVPNITCISGLFIQGYPFAFL